MRRNGRDAPIPVIRGTGKARTRVQRAVAEVPRDVTSPMPLAKNGLSIAKPPAALLQDYDAGLSECV
jgi:hypothetical protein